MSATEAQDNDTRRQSSSTAETLPAPTEQKTTEDSDVLGQYKRDFGFLPIPPGVRYDPEHPAHFGIAMNALFGIASTFSTPHSLLSHS